MEDLLKKFKKVVGDDKPSIEEIKTAMLNTFMNHPVGIYFGAMIVLIRKRRGSEVALQVETSLTAT
ncbi:hypothetical protein KKD19_02830 [Patescibacteria group bacterium]|nr:hypothetical protein [Patescibacteria group bacterium]MBU4512152.1 hypothetical protein [Patescibacteria group bacterium]MCG2693044.1 hypothetical protein [Candidatus Parcubacteria bacterium]